MPWLCHSQLHGINQAQKDGTVCCEQGSLLQLMFGSDRVGPEFIGGLYDDEGWAGTYPG